MVHAFLHFWALSLSLSLYFAQKVATSHVYIVYLGHNQNNHPLLTTKHHLQLLSNVFASKEDAKQAMVYSYKHSFSGFSALLNSTQAKILGNTRGVISVFKSKTLHLHTTRSWDFVGLNLNYSAGVPLQQAYGDDVVVGIFDTDISAPGINIVGAWPPRTSPTVLPGEGRSVSWNLQSGTSMSCPHVSGVVALLKSAHPDWSPAAIMSALMTTAYNKDTSGYEILAGGSMKISDPFDIGAGHINPLQAMDPGLVYDMKIGDYVIFLCNSGYSWDQIKSMVIITSEAGIPTNCPPPQDQGVTSNSNLNYPSITVPNLQRTTTIKRTLRNVGTEKTAIYFVSILSPNGVNVKVWPRLLFFSPLIEEFTYYVTVTPMKLSQGRYDFGEIVWSDGLHFVTSPLVVFVNTNFGDS